METRNSPDIKKILGDNKICPFQTSSILVDVPPSSNLALARKGDKQAVDLYRPCLKANCELFSVADSCCQLTSIFLMLNIIAGKMCGENLPPAPDPAAITQ